MPDFTLECERFFEAADRNKPTYYSAYAIATNFNTAICILAPPSQLRGGAGKHKRLILEGISLYVAAGAAGVTAYPVIIPAQAPIQYVTGETKMTEYAYDSLVWQNLHIPVDLVSIFAEPVTLISMNLGNYAATDDLTMYIWGYLE